MRDSGANGEICYPLIASVMSTEPNQPMGKFVYASIFKTKSTTNWSNPWTSIHMGTIQPRRRTQRKSKEGYLCAVFVCVVCGISDIAQQLTDYGDPVAVSLCGLHMASYTSAYSKEIPGKLLACCVSVWNASARRSRIILKGTWLTASNRLEHPGYLYILAPIRLSGVILKTVPAVYVSCYQHSDMTNYPPPLVWSYIFMAYMLL